MAHLTPIRDASGGIIGLQGDESQFAATLAESMVAVGATEPAPPPTAATPRLAMIVGGLVAALALVAALNLLQGQPAPVRSAPTAPPAPATATRAPTATPSSTSTPTALPEAPTPIVIIQQAPPVQCYSVTLDVADGHGTPIGIATGESCESQDAARANAEAQAAEMRAAHEKR